MGKQIFQTESKSRWTRFLWTLRVIAVIIVLLVITFITMFALEGSPHMPLIREYRRALTAEKPLMKSNEMSNSIRLSVISSKKRTCTTTIRLRQ
jgi:heme/copper-type cytochrome/quinol oxidase subunit 2